MARRRFRRVLSAEGALEGLAGGAIGAAALLLVLKAFFQPAPAGAVWTARALPVAGLAIGALLRLRRMPTAQTLAALTEDASHAGGLLLVHDLPGAERWAAPAVTVPPVRAHLLPRLPGALAGMLLFIGATLVPAAWFEPSAPVIRTFPDVTAPLRDELAEIRAEETLPPDEIAAIEEEIARIEAAADPLRPAETLDAVDRLADRLSALLDLNEATARRLTADRRELTTRADADRLARQFKDMLASAPSSEDTMKGRRVVRKKGCCCNGDGEGDGDGGGDGCGSGDKPGSGAPTRGRGDAPMDWKEPTETEGARFRDEARGTASAADGDTEKTGESISHDDPTARAVRTVSTATTALGGRSSGVSVNRPVLPRHRAAVKRFFETERNGQ